MAEDCDAYRDLSNEPDLTDVPPEAWQFFGVGFDTGVEETAAVANEIPETCAEVDDANTTTMIDSTRKLTGGRTVLTMREITISAVVYEELPQT